MYDVVSEASERGCLVLCTGRLLLGSLRMGRGRGGAVQERAMLTVGVGLALLGLVSLSAGSYANRMRDGGLWILGDGRCAPEERMSSNC